LTFFPKSRPVGDKEGIDPDADTNAGPLRKMHLIPHAEFSTSFAYIRQCFRAFFR
jgi:hypothetical protein